MPRSVDTSSKTSEKAKGAVIPEVQKASEVKVAVEKKVVQKTKEKTNPIKLESISRKLLDKAEINPEFAINQVASILGVSEKYDEKFVIALKKFQKEHGLEDDGKLGDKTLAVFILIHKDKIDTSKLSKNKDILSFQKSIEQKNVTPQQLEKMLGFFSKYTNSIDLTKIDFSKLKFDKLLGENSTNTFIAGILYTKFNQSSESKDKKFDEVKKKEKAMIAEAKEKTQKQAKILLKQRGLTDKQAEIILNNSSTSSSQNQITFEKGSFEEKALKISNSIKSNPMLMTGAFIGFIMFIFGKRDGFAKAGFFGLLAVLGGPGLIKTGKEIMETLGVKMPEFDPAKVDKAKAATQDAITKVSDKAKSLAEKAGVKFTDLKESIFKKNTSIIETAKSKYPNLKETDLQTIAKELGGDDTFKSKKFENIIGTKFSDLSKETQKTLTDKGIKENSQEFTAYLETLKEKIVEARKKDSSIIKVGDYFDKFDITGEQIGTLVGIGTAVFSLFKRSPLGFMLGAAITAESQTHFFQDFFESGKGKSIKEQTKKIIDKYANRIDAEFNLLQLNEIDKKYISNLLEKHDYNFLRKKYKTNSKITKFINFAEEQYYTAEVESKTGNNGFISGAIDYLKDKYTETTEDFDNAKKSLKEGIASLEKLHKKINESSISNKAKLLDKLQLEILNSKDKLKLLILKQNNSKIDKVNELEKEKEKLEKELIEFNKKTPTTEKEKIKHRMKTREKQEEIDEIEKKLNLAKNEKTKVLSTNFEEVTEEYKTKLSNAIETLKEINSRNIDISTFETNKVKNIFTEIETIKKKALEAGNKGLDFSKFDIEQNKLKAKVEAIGPKIISEITLSNFPAVEKQIKNYQNILSKLNISTDFNTKVNESKKAIFENKIGSASIEDIAVFNEYFSRVGIDNFSGKVEKRLEILAKSTLAKNDKEINDLIEKLEKEKIDESILNKLKSKKTIFDLYKYIYGSDLFENIQKYIENKYGKLHIKKELNTQTTSTTKTDIDKVKPKSNEKSSNSNNQDIKVKILPVDKLFGN